MKQIYEVILLLSLTSIAGATQINVYYPNNNTTTDIYYANASGYNHIINNTINDNISIVILKNQPIVDDIISNPKKLMDMKYIGLFLFIMLFGLSILMFVKIFK